jgi:phage terminase large subunit-like protein
LANDIGDHGFETGRFVQSPKNFDGPMREFERAYREGRIYHDGSSWLRYCLSNVRCEVNKYGEIAPRANKSVDHIDGAVAALLAFHSACTPADTIRTGISWL